MTAATNSTHPDVSRSNPEYGPLIITRNDLLKNCICPRPLNSG